MRKFKFTKKAAAIGLAAGIALGAGGIAAAYFTSSGSGTATATVTGPSSVTLTGHVSLSAVTAGTVTHVAVTVTNPNASAITLANVTITGITPASATCPAGSFTSAAAATALGKVSHGSTSFTTTAKTPTVTLNTLPTAAQTACESGATVHLHVNAG